MKKLGFNEFQLLSQGAAPFLLLKEPQLLPAATTIRGSLDRIKQWEDGLGNLNLRILTVDFKTYKGKNFDLRF